MFKKTLRRQSSFLALFCALGLNLALLPAFADQMMPFECPLTPRTLFETSALGWFTTDKRNLKLVSNERSSEFLIFCLMNYLEEKNDLMTEEQFQQSRKELVDYYIRLGLKGWSIQDLELSKEALLLKLRDTLAGQRYIRFARVSKCPDGSIKFRFSHPEVYGLNVNQLILTESDPAHHYHERTLEHDGVKVGIEVVEIARGRHSDLDWDSDCYLKIRPRRAYTR